MDPINGITIEKYAELCAKMDDVFKNNAACLRIAEKEGISRANWEAAHEGWQSRITDPADMGRTASHFNSLWNQALNKKETK